MATTRQRRVNELLKEEVGKILQREVSDPRVGFATVTEVDVAPDLRQARVYVSVLGPHEEQTQSLEAIRRAAGYIRGLLARRVDLRVAPELTFELDRSLERGTHVLDLLQSLEKDEAKDEDGAEPA